MKDSKKLEKEFFDFVKERQKIWYNRFILNKNFPWTRDETLKKFKIINMYRELDRCTQYLIKKLKDIKDRKKILMNVVFYRFFNLNNLYEMLDVEVLDKIDSENLIKKFDLLKRTGPIFNNAYLISSGTKGKPKHIEIIENLERMSFRELVNGIDKSKTPEESFEVIEKIPLVGPFLACEIWTDLTYFNFFRRRWTDDDFVNIGPGAKWGLEIIYGKLKKKKLYEKLKYLYNIQKDFLDNKRWKKIAYKESFSNYPFLSITNIEGALCEFRKYHRLKDGLGKKRYFKIKKFL